MVCWPSLIKAWFTTGLIKCAGLNLGPHIHRETRPKRSLDPNPTRPIYPHPALFSTFSAPRHETALACVRITSSFSLSLSPKPQMQISNPNLVVFLGFLLCIFMAEEALCIRIPNRTPEFAAVDDPNRPLKVAVFALGSFWRSESVFGCLPGVFRTTVGYAGGTKTNPEFRSLGDHAESVQVRQIRSVLISRNPWEVADFLNLDSLFVHVRVLLNDDFVVLDGLDFWEF